MVTKHSRPQLSLKQTTKLSSRIRSVLFISSAAFLFILCVWGYCWWNSPEHRLAEFIAATSHGDAAQVLSLADTSEIRHLNLTPAKFQGMLDESAGVSPNRVRLGEAIEEPLNSYQRGFNRLIKIALLDANGKPLTGLKGGDAYVYTYAYQTDNGWKIGISHFLNATRYVRYGTTHLQYPELCSHYQVPSEILNPTSCMWEAVVTR